MKSVKYFIVVLTTALLFTGCSEDDVINGCGEQFWAEEVASEAEALSATASQFGLDPTVANCNAFRAAAQNYLDALEGARPCVDSSERADFDEAVNEAQASINDLDCNLDA